MTINHPNGLWGYGTGSASLDGQQIATRIKRLYPTGRSPFGVTSAVSIRPYVFPWTATIDSNGVAFPAGLVGIATTTVLSGAGSYAAQLEAGWNAPSFGGVVAVPGVLPAGYTARLNREWHSSSQSLARVRTADGYNTITWMPAPAPFGSGDIKTGGFNNTTYPGLKFNSGNPCTGFRALQMKVGLALFPASEGYGWTAGSCTVRVSHNADGSAVPDGSGDGDTIDGEVNFSYTDLADSGIDVGGFRIWYTGYKTVTNALASSLGTLTRFYARDVDSGFGSSFSWSNPSIPDSGTLPIERITGLTSPRLDVPYPFTVTGIGDLIALGGLVT